MPVAYTKPHLTYAQQVALLRSRGLHCPDEDSAIRLLRAVGYYRLSAYVYPFRDMLPAEERQRSSPTQFRSDTIKDGASLEHVESLWRFDRKLRLLLLDAVETVEIGMRTQIAYVLGERDTFGHTHVSARNERACGEPARRREPLGPTRHEAWLQRYEQAVAESREDFLRHNTHKYEELPIGVAVETLTFGAISRLYGLMRQDDQTRIANGLGVRGVRFSVLGSKRSTTFATSQRTTPASGTGRPPIRSGVPLRVKSLNRSDT